MHINNSPKRSCDMDGAFEANIYPCKLTLMMDGCINSQFIYCSLVVVVNLFYIDLYNSSNSSLLYTS